MSSKIILLLNLMTLLGLSSCTGTGNQFGGPVSPSGTITHPLNIKYHTFSGMSGPDVAPIIGEMIQIGRQCKITFQQSGNVGTFNVFGTINSGSDFENLFAQTLTGTDPITPAGIPRKVRVVNQIRFCGNSFGTSIVGCGGGKSIAVVHRSSWSDTAYASLWIHEFGHTKRLPHRTGSGAVMTASTDYLNSPGTLFNTNECNNMRQLNLIGESEQPLILNSLAPGSVEEFVRTTFANGVPYQEARQYKSAANLTILESMLSDENEKPYWSNIVTVIGIIAEPLSESILLSFIEDGTSGIIDRDHYLAKTDAIISYGYIILENNSQTALDYLKEGTFPDEWTVRSIDWIPPYYSTDLERNEDLAVSATIGLALSGNKTALSHLMYLRERSEQFSRDQYVGVLEQAIESNTYINANGITSYQNRGDR